MSLFRFCWRGCRHHPSFGKRVERIFWPPFFEFINILCQFPGVSAGAPLLFRGFVLRSFVEFGTLDFAPVARTCEWFPALDLSLPEFKRRIVVFENSPVWFDPIFPSSRNGLFLRTILGHTSQLKSFNEATDPCAPTFFDFLLGCPPASVCRNLHLSTYLHLDSDLWFQHTGGCQKSHDGSVHVPLVKFLHGFLPFKPEGLSPFRLPYLQSFLPSVRVGAVEGEEDDCARWPEWDPLLKLQESLLEHCPVAFHWMDSPTFLSTLTFFPFRLLTDTLVSIL